jgi:phage terminase large subunit GpA-like protein
VPVTQVVESIDDRAARRRAARSERETLRAVFQRPPKLTLTEWADEYRYLSPEASAAPGKYSSDRAPYQREPMNALSDRQGRKVVLMWPSQVGKTEILNNFIGKRIDLEPGPMLVLQPTLEMAEAWSRDRLAPMLRDTPSLQGKVKDPRARNADNTILWKKFPGGHLTIAGANSPAGLASRPIRDILCDEVDRYPASAGAEGDPIGLAFRRGTTFSNGRRLLISSPTIKGQSRIEKEYEDGTQEKWYVPCPECGHEQILRWGGRDKPFGIKWDQGKPESAFYVCEKNACVIEERWKGWMNARGRWIADNPDHPTRSFWTNALISRWARWGDLVREWLQVKADPIRLRQFVNTVLCETWEDEGAELDAHFLAERLEQYPCRCSEEEKEAEGHERGCGTLLVPAGAAVLVRSVDTQDDRLETSVWAFGAGEEAWLIETEILPGSPGTPEPWKLLDEVLQRRYEHESGRKLKPAVTFIDSGGHHAKEVYSYCRARLRRKVFAIKGSSLEGAPLLGKPSRNNAAKTILYPIGSFTGKESVMARFEKIREPGPGYIHLPLWLDPQQIQQFTNEALVKRLIGNRYKREWIPKGRNEQLDLIVYALAALQVLGVRTLRRLGKIAAEMMAAAGTPGGAETGAGSEEIDVPTPVASPAKPRPRGGQKGGGWMKGGGGGGWMNGGRR